MSSYHYLEVYLEGNASNEMFALSSAEAYQIGRHSNNDLVLKSKVISRHHASIIPIKTDIECDNYYWIIDGGLNNQRSTNGFMVNEESVLVHNLLESDIILFPDQTRIIYKVFDEPYQNINTLRQINNKASLSKITEIGLKTSIDNRILVNNEEMLYAVMEKEIKSLKNKEENISFIYLLYNLKKINNLHLKLFKLVIAQQLLNLEKCIISIGKLDILVIHDLSKKDLENLASQVILAIDVTREQLKIEQEEKLVAGVYGQANYSVNCRLMFKKAYTQLKQHYTSNQFLFEEVTL